MAKSVEKLRALKLRRKGASMRSIAERLGVSKGSVSLWCRDIVLTDSQKLALQESQINAGHRGRIMGAMKNKQKRLDAMAAQEEIAHALVGTLSDRDTLMLGIALYWGEGIKSQTGGAGIVNSDPETVLFARKWFEQLGVTRDLFRPYIFISEIHRPRELKILNFWSQFLQIPREQFSKIVFLKGRPKKIYENHDSYYGVLALRVRRGSGLKYKILGLIRSCKEKAGVAQWQ